MTWRSLSRLRVSLLLLVLVALLPAFGLIIYDAAADRRLAYQEIQSRAMRQAGRFAAEQELRIAAARHLLTGLGQSPAVHAHDPNACTDLFQATLKQLPDLTGLVAATPIGEVFCSSAPFPRGVTFSDRAYFQRALETRRFAAGEYAIGRISGKSNVQLAYPAVDRSGTVRAVLVAGLDLSWLAPAAAQAGLAPGTVVNLIDRNGTILSRYPDHERWMGTSVPGFVDTVVVRKEWGGETQGVDGIRRIYARTPLQLDAAGSPAAYATLGIPTDSARLEINRALTRNLTAYAIVAGLVFLVAWVGSDVFVLRRINTLLGAARRLGAGDLSARTGLRHGPGELEQLARAFDEMGDRLERDTAEQRRAVEEIAARRRFLHEVIDLNPNIVFAKDQRGRYTLVNKSFADFYGAPIEALIGKTDADLGRNVEQVERWRRDDLEVLETGRDKLILEERVTDATGQERWLQVVKRAIAPVDGTATHVLGVATDITERKNLELQLFQTQKLEAIGQLAGGVAHDFNNLLTVILGRCALVLDRLSPDASPRRDIDLIQKTAERAVALTRQLLAFSRKQILEPKVLDLNAVVPDIATMLQRLIGEDIVKQSGGNIGVYSEPGRGTTFKVYLPRVEDAAEPVQDKGPTAGRGIGCDLTPSGRPLHRS